MSLQESLKKFDKKFNFWNDTTEQRNAVKELFSQEIKIALESVVMEEMNSNNPENHKHKRDFLYKFDNGYNSCREELLKNIEDYLTK